MPGNLVPSLLVAIVKMLRDQRGASAAIVAIALPGLIGFGALGVETGVWFTIRLQNQTAADAAALSAAYQVLAGKTDATTELIPAAAQAAAQNGYKGRTPTLTYPYGDDIVRNGVAVDLQQTQAALLAAMFLPEVTITTKAVAVVELLDNPCVLALAKSGTGVEVADLARLAMPSCSVAANSISRTAIDLHGSTSSIIASTLVTSGEVAVQGTPLDPAALPPEFVLAAPAQIGAPSVPDPYASTLTHAFLSAGMPVTGNCKSKNSGRVRIYDGNCLVSGASLNRPRIRLSDRTQISGPWTIAAGQTVDLSPGNYWVSGDLTLQAGAMLKCSACDNVKGTGVTIILIEQGSKVGTMSMAANAAANLNAPNSGRFAGLLLVQDANGLPPGTSFTSSQSAIGGGAGTTLNGLIYFPRSSMTFHGNPGANGPGCLILVVAALIVDETASLDNRGCPSAGLGILPAVYTAALAE